MEHFGNLIATEEETGQQLAAEPPRLAGKGPVTEQQAVQRERQRQAAIRRRQLNRLTGWTEHFHQGLMREFALAEVLMRESGPSSDVRALSERPWYCPLGDHPDWAAWGVVVEIALRRRIAAWRGIAPTFWAQDSPWVEPVEHAYPAVLFAENSETGNEWSNHAGEARLVTPVARQSVALRLQNLENAGRRAPFRQPLRARPPVLWAIPDDGAAWWRDPRTANGVNHSDERRPLHTPSARTLWQWAVRDPAPRSLSSPHDASPAQFAGFFGEGHGQRSPADAA